MIYRSHISGVGVESASLVWCACARQEVVAIEGALLLCCVPSVGGVTGPAGSLSLSLSLKLLFGHSRCTMLYAVLLKSKVVS